MSCQLHLGSEQVNKVVMKWMQVNKMRLQGNGAMQYELRKEKEGDASGLSFLLSRWRKLTIYTSNGASQYWWIWQQRIYQLVYICHYCGDSLDR